MTKSNNEMLYSSYLNESADKLLLVDDADFDNQWGVELDSTEYESYRGKWVISKPFFVTNGEELKRELFLNRARENNLSVFLGQYFDTDFYMLTTEKQLELIQAICNVLYQNFINQFDEEFSDEKLSSLWENAELLNVKNYKKWIKEKKN